MCGLWIGFIVTTLFDWRVATFYRYLGNLKNRFWCVGRGVLRFWTVRYRKPRSNFGLFSKIEAIPVSGGVDIIYWEWLFGDGLMSRYVIYIAYIKFILLFKVIIFNKIIFGMHFVVRSGCCVHVGC